MNQSIGGMGDSQALGAAADHWPEARPAAGAAVPVDDCWNRIGVYGDARCVRLDEAVHCRNCDVYANAAIRLLDREPVDAQSLVAASEVAVDDASMAEQPAIGRFLIFRVGDEWLGVSARAIAQVLPEPAILPIAKRRGGLRPGIANVGGAATVALRLSRLLEIAERPGAASLSIVFEHAGYRTLLAVDEVADVLTVRTLQRLPATLDRALQHYVFATAVWHDQPVGLLDAERLHEGITRGLG